MRSIQPCSSSSLRAFASDSIGCRCVTFSSCGDRLAADALRRRVGRQQLGMRRLDRAQLVEQRVVSVVADDRVVEDVVAVAVVGQLSAQLRRARGRIRAPSRRRRSLHLARGRRDQPREVVLLQRADPRAVREVEVHRRDARCARPRPRRCRCPARRPSAPRRRRCGTGGGSGAPRPAARARPRRCACRAASPRRRSGSPPGTLTFSSVPAAQRHLLQLGRPSAP